MTDNELNDSDIQWQLLGVASDWMKGRKVALWNPALYQERLSYSTERVETDRLMLELFLEDTKKSR